METSLGVEEAGWRSSLCHSCHFLLPAFPSAKKLRISLLSFSFTLMVDTEIPKIRNKRQRAEGKKILKHSSSNNWSKNSHCLLDGRKEENERSVSAGFYLLNLCPYSIRDMAKQASFKQARPPQWKELSPIQLHSHQLGLCLPPLHWSTLAPSLDITVFSHGWADVGLCDGPPGYEIREWHPPLQGQISELHKLQCSLLRLPVFCFYHTQAKSQMVVDLDKRNIWGEPHVH